MRQRITHLFRQSPNTGCHPRELLKNDVLQADSVAYRALLLIEDTTFLKFRLRVCHFLMRRQKTVVEATERFESLLRTLSNQRAMKNEIEENITTTTLLLSTNDQQFIQNLPDGEYKAAYHTAILTSVLWTLCGLDFHSTYSAQVTFGPSSDFFFNGDVNENPWATDSLEAEVACIEGDIMFAREMINPVNSLLSQQSTDEVMFANLMKSYIHGTLSDPDKYIDYMLSKCFTNLLLEELGSKLTASEQEEFRQLCGTAASLTGVNATATAKMLATAVCHLTQFVPPIDPNTSLFKRHHSFSTELLNAGIAYIARYQGHYNGLTILHGSALAMVQMMRFMASLETEDKLSTAFAESTNLVGAASPLKPRILSVWEQHRKIVEPIRSACGSTYPVTSTRMFSDEVADLWRIEIDSAAMDKIALEKELRNVPFWVWKWLSTDVLHEDDGLDRTSAYTNLVNVRTMLDIQGDDKKYMDWLSNSESRVLDARGDVANKAVQTTDTTVPAVGLKLRQAARFDRSKGGMIRVWAVLTANGLMDAVLARITPSETACVFSSLVTGYLLPDKNFVDKARYYTLAGKATNPSLTPIKKLLLKLPPKDAVLEKSYPGAIVLLRNEIRIRADADMAATTIRLQTLVNESALHGPEDLNQAVREVVVDRLVEQGGFGTPLRSWAKELHTAQNQEINSHPLACEVGLRRLTTGFIKKYEVFYAGEPENVADTVSSMASSVMSLTGGANSPFERERSEVMQRLAAELDAVHAPAILAILRDAEAKPEVEEFDADLLAVPYATDPLPPRVTAAPAPRVTMRLCFRPFRRYRMGTGILCQAGEALGNTFRGHEDFQMTDNIIAKTHIGHYTMWHKAVVVDDRRLYLAEDMFCSGYVGGEGHKSVELSLVIDDKENFMEDPIAWMESRKGGDGASILTIEVDFPPTTTMSSMPRSFYLTNFSATLDKLRGNCIHVDPKEVDDLFQGLNSVEDAAGRESYLTDMGGLNTVCFRTMEISTEGETGMKTIRTLNQGHFGVNGTYEGARRPRSGYIETFKDCKYEQHLLRNH